MRNKQNYKQERSRKDPRTKRRRPSAKKQTTKRKEVIVDTAPSATDTPEEGVHDDIDLHININTTVADTPGEVAECSKSASAKKLKLGGDPDEQQQKQKQMKDGEIMMQEGDFSYVFIDTLVFINLLRDIGRCQKCDDKLEIIHQIESKKGLCHLFIYARKHDMVRIRESDRKSTAETKSERKKLNAKRKHFGDKEKEKEGEMASYAPGEH